MAIKMPPKADLPTENQESDAWIKEGKKADDKAVDKKLRKQISVYLDRSSSLSRPPWQSSACWNP